MRRKTSRHYKMYKAKKIWMTAGLTTFAVAMGGGAFNVSAHADTVNNDTNTSSATTLDTQNNSATSSVVTTQAIDTNAMQSSSVTSTRSSDATSTTQNSSVTSTQSSDATSMTQNSSVTSTRSSDATSTTQNSSVTSTQSSDATSMTQNSSVTSTQSSDATSTTQNSSVTSTRSSDATSTQSSSVTSTQSSDATSTQNSSVISVQSSDATTMTLNINSLSSEVDTASNAVTNALLYRASDDTVASSGLTSGTYSLAYDTTVFPSGAGIVQLSSMTSGRSVLTADGRYVETIYTSDAVPISAADFAYDPSNIVESYAINDIHVSIDKNGNALASGGTYYFDSGVGGGGSSSANSISSLSFANNASSSVGIKTLQFQNVNISLASSQTSDSSNNYMLGTMLNDFMKYSTNNNTLRTVDLSNTSGWNNFTNMSNFLGGSSQYYSLNSINLGNNFDTSNVTNISGFFQTDPYLANVTFGPKFDTSKVTNFDNFAWGDLSLASLDFRNSNFSLASWKPTYQTVTDNNGIQYQMIANPIFRENGNASSSVSYYLGDHVGKLPTNINGMFANLSNSTYSIDLGNDFDTSNVTSMAYLFGDVGYTDYTKRNFSNSSWSQTSAYNLKTIILGDKFDTSNVRNMKNVFGGAELLSNLKVTSNKTQFDATAGLPTSMYLNGFGSSINLNGNKEIVSSGIYTTDYVQTYSPYYNSLSSYQADISTNSTAAQVAVASNQAAITQASQQVMKAKGLLNQANSVASSLNANYTLSDKASLLSQVNSYVNSISSVVTQLNSNYATMQTLTSLNNSLPSGDSQVQLSASLASQAVSYAVIGQGYTQSASYFSSLYDDAKSFDDRNSYSVLRSSAYSAAELIFASASNNLFSVSSIDSTFASQANVLNNSVNPFVTSGSASATSLFNTLNLNLLLSQATVATSAQSQANAQSASAQSSSAQSASIAAQLAKQSADYAASIASLKAQQASAIAAHDSSAANSAQSALTSQANANNNIINSLTNLQSSAATQVTSAISVASSNAGLASQNASALSSAQNSANSVTSDLASVNAQKNSLTSAYNSAVSSANSLSATTSSAYASEIASFSVAISSMLVAQSQVASSATSVQNSQSVQNASLSSVNASLIVAQNSAKSSYTSVQASYASASANAQSNYSSAMSSLQSVSNTKLSSATSLATSLSAAQSSAIQNHDSVTASGYQSQMSSFVSATSSANTNALNSQAISLANSYAQQSQSVTPSSVAPTSSSSSNTATLSSSNNTVSTSDGYAKIDKAITVQYANGNLKLNPAQKPVFDVLRHTIESNGQHVYYVKYRGRVGKVVSKTALFKPAYYKTLNFDKAANANGEAYVKVLNNIYEHKHDKFSVKGLKTYHKGSRIKVVGISTNKGVTRFQLANGHVITANKYYVSLIK